MLSGDEPGPHGIQGIGAGFKPGVLDTGLLDEVMRVSEGEAIAAARRCAMTEGLPIGNLVGRGTPLPHWRLPHETRQRVN